MSVLNKSSRAGALGQALVDFALEGVFPEGDASSLAIRPDELPAAIDALTAAKVALENEIHKINEETADDVGSWVSNANTLQADINRTKNLANDIVRQAEAPVASGKVVEDAEARADFLVRELRYNQQVRGALKGIKAVSETLDRAENARDGRRILDALHLLESAWTQLDAISVSKSCKAIRLLDMRAFELKSDVHAVLDHVWNALIHVDVGQGKLSINGGLPDEAMTLEDAVIGLKAYRELDKKMEQLWHLLDAAIVLPRTVSRDGVLPSIEAHDDVLERRGSADGSIKAVFADLEKVFGFLAQNLPPDLVQSLAAVMMPDLSGRITSVWLDSAVPSSLESMGEFQDVIGSAKEFCATLTSLNFPRTEELWDWADNAPRVWLAKCRETALDTVRTKLAEGLGQPKEVERVEKQMVSRSEGKQLAANSAAVPAENQDWDSAWPDDEDQSSNGPAKTGARDNTHPEAETDGADAWGWGEEDEEPSQPQPEPSRQRQEDEDIAMKDEDDTDAWGWGADDSKEEEEHPSTRSRAKHAVAETRELTLKETYNISSLPEPMLSLISAIVEDGAALTRDEYADSPVAAAAAGLFSLPTLALAMFRAVSPYYYALDLGGNMYLYNDVIYLADKLGDFAAAWKEREDLGAKAKAMLRVENDIKILQSFATRAYSNEMNVQKTVLRDLLGGEQNVVQQEEAESSIDAAVARVRSMAVTWESILARSAWYQAVGSLIETVSSKIITDVMDMSAIGQDEAYSIAKLIATVTELDDLFLPSPSLHPQKDHGEPAPEEIPTTAQYASSWLRLKYLSEILQSNLRDVRFLWVESELSLYFSAEEVVELVNMSFEDNQRTREVIREITQNPRPVQ